MIGRRLLEQERGFTLIELLSAVFVLSIGVLALISTFDGSRGLISFSEQKETAIHVAEQELEELRSLAYEAVALDGVPPSGAGTDDLGHYASAGWYRWDRDPAPAESKPVPRCTASGEPASSCERLISGGSVPAAVETRTTTGPGGGARLTLELQRFVTWADDDCSRVAPGQAAPLCAPASGADYKRITVEVRVVPSGAGSRLDAGLRSPLVISSVVRQR